MGLSHHFDVKAAGGLQRSRDSHTGRLLCAEGRGSAVAPADKVSPVARQHHTGPRYSHPLPRSDPRDSQPGCWLTPHRGTLTCLTRGARDADTRFRHSADLRFPGSDTSASQGADLAIGGLISSRASSSLPSATAGGLGRGPGTWPASTVGSLPMWASAAATRRRPRSTFGRRRQAQGVCRRRPHCKEHGADRRAANQGRSRRCWGHELCHQDPHNGAVINFADDALVR